MEMIREIPIPAPAAEAGKVIGEQFGDIGAWATAIARSHVDGPVELGAIRTCRIPQFGPVPPGKLRERLVEFDPENMALTYEVLEGLPGIFKHAQNRWTVEARGPDACVVRTHATMQLRFPMNLFAPLMKRQLIKASNTLPDELAHRVVHGEAHPLKLAKLVEQGRLASTRAA